MICSYKKPAAATIHSVVKESTMPLGWPHVRPFRLQRCGPVWARYWSYFERSRDMVCWVTFSCNFRHRLPLKPKRDSTIKFHGICLTVRCTCLQDFEYFYPYEISHRTLVSTSLCIADTSLVRLIRFYRPSVFSCVRMWLLYIAGSPSPYWISHATPFVRWLKVPDVVWRPNVPLSLPNSLPVTDMFLNRLELRWLHCMENRQMLQVASGVQDSIGSAVELLVAKFWIKFDFHNVIVEKWAWTPGIAYVDPPWHHAVCQKDNIETLIHSKKNRKRILLLNKGPSCGRIWESWGPTFTVLLQT